MRSRDLSKLQYQTRTKYGICQNFQFQAYTKLDIKKKKILKI